LRSNPKKQGYERPQKQFTPKTLNQAFQRRNKGTNSHPKNKAASSKKGTGKNWGSKEGNTVRRKKGAHFVGSFPGGTRRRKSPSKGNNDTTTIEEHTPPIDRRVTTRTG